MVAELVRSWQAEITRLDPRLRDLVITADHGDFWHLSFELGETWHEAVSGDLGTFAFPDHAGYFEDEVPAAGVPRRVVELFA
ncbi:hypothetical protein [Nocardia sp. NRRL S-836]|uniref:hypothetical protein n=1 Tax=Nocardia sp. NRRL S-836 TaxID=1519492 RepID=UPI000AA9CD35|nr:hypothetical protein [Nocardia sp. NRRL S-836]